MCPCAQGFNGADLRNICTEAGMFAIRDERDYVVHEDFMKVSAQEGAWGSWGRGTEVLARAALRDLLV